MKSLKEELFKDRKGNPVKIAFNDGEAEEVGLGKLLLLLASSFQPSTEFRFSLDNWRKMYKVLDVLEKGPVDSMWNFEDADFEILNKVAMYQILNIPAMAIHSVMLEELLK